MLGNVVLAPTRVHRIPRAEAEARGVELLTRFGLAGRERDFPDAIAELKVEGKTMIFATHEMRFARAVANEVCFLHRGVILERGAPGGNLRPTPGAGNAALSRTRAQGRSALHRMGVDGTSGWGGGSGRPSDDSGGGLSTSS